MPYHPPVLIFSERAPVAQTPVRRRPCATRWTERTPPPTLHAGEVAEGEEMDEQEWLKCMDPRPMFAFLQNRANVRKWRLFACACCRRIWDLLSENGSHRNIEAAEQYADGRASLAELDARPQGHILETAVDFAVSYAGYSGPHDWDLDHVAFSAGYVLQAVRDANRRQRRVRAAVKAEERTQANLPRDLYGNPFRIVVFSPSWRTPAVLTLAQAAYENRTLPAGTLDPDRLAVLADALEEAGCDNADILSHLRGPGPHVRGCWVVDLLLGKE